MACTASAVVEAGTAMAAVMITLAAATRNVTMLAASAALTLRPAAIAIFCGKFEALMSAKSSILPLAVKVSTTVTAEGGGDGGDGGGDGGRTGGEGGREGGGGGGAVSLPPRQAQHKPALFCRPLAGGPAPADCHV